MFFNIFYLFLIDSAVNSIFVAPAVTPIRDFSEPYSNNPAVRLYFYDKQDFGILVSLDGPPLPNPCRSTKGKPIFFFFFPMSKDLWQYFLNLTEANLQQRANWKLEYVMTKAFAMPDLRPLSLLRLAVRLWLPPNDAFDAYFAHFTVSYDGRPSCQGDCKILQLCSMLHLDQARYGACVGARQHRHSLASNLL